MNAIHKTELSLIRSDLKQMGINPESEDWGDFNVVLPKVTGYRIYSTDEEEEPNKTCVYLGTEQSFTINTPYKLFDKIMQDFYNNHKAP